MLFPTCVEMLLINLKLFVNSLIMNNLHKLGIFRKFGPMKWQQIIGHDIKHGNNAALQEKPIELH